MFKRPGKEPLARNVNCYPRSIARDPPTTELLGAEGCRSRSARWVKNQITWLGCHCNAAIKYLVTSLNSVNRTGLAVDVIPQIGARNIWPVVPENDTAKRLSTSVKNAPQLPELGHSFFAVRPMSIGAAFERLFIEHKIKTTFTRVLTN